jgi:hypothetical protein
MNVTELHQRLIAAARANPPSDRVPYAFEKRIMARLAALPALDGWAQWSRAMWRAVAPCVVMALLVAVWMYFTPKTDNAPVDLSQDFDNTLLVAVDNANNYSE